MWRVKTSLFSLLVLSLVPWRDIYGLGNRALKAMCEMALGVWRHV